MSLNKRLLPLACATSLACAMAPAAQAASGDSMSWFFAPYLWMPNVTGDLETPRGEVDGSGQTFFPDVVDKLEGAFLGHLEGQGDHFGFLTDVMWLKLGDGRDFDRFSTDSDLSAWIVDAAAVWSPATSRYEGVELYGGLRFLDVSLETTLDPVDPNLPKVDVGPSTDFFDVLVGARYIGRINPRWSFTGKLDGSWGDTEGTFSAAASLGYTRNPDSGSWIFGYRYMQIEVGSNDETLELDMYGPLVGYAFVW